MKSSLRKIEFLAWVFAPKAHLTYNKLEQRLHRNLSIGGDRGQNIRTGGERGFGTGSTQHEYPHLHSDISPTKCSVP
jgi:hypothetical protein